MGLYERYLLPKLLNAVMKSPDLELIRSQIVPEATGRVLEVGIGSGLNLPFYNDDVKVTGLDPSAELQVYAREVAEKEGIDVEFIGLSGEDIPSEDNFFDSIVITWTLCTIPDPVKALAEMRRVLKPGGKMIFAEHGLAPDTAVAKWQSRINPVWKLVAGGCNLNREIDKMITDTGFKLDALAQGYIPGPKFATYNYRGVARVV
ncbi:MAG: class I SAM-dependent methyltransferase [Pseudomonadales bacterium]